RSPKPGIVYSTRSGPSGPNGEASSKGRQRRPSMGHRRVSRRRGPGLCAPAEPGTVVSETGRGQPDALLVPVATQIAGERRAHDISAVGVDRDLVDTPVGLRARGRAEEHTSELQSRENIVCRLLLEKKKNVTTRL